jgi:hypothetical protein
LSRIKANITDVSSEYKVWALFGKNPTKLQNMKGKFFLDPRSEKLGYRCILPSSWAPPGNSPMYRSLIHKVDATTVAPDVYKVYRLLHGVPEGESELPTTQALPFEYNFDFLNGVAYDKGSVTIIAILMP